MLRACPLLLLCIACGQAVELPAPAPLADAGDDQLRKLLPSGTTIGLDGRASCDPEARGIERYVWTLRDRPEDSTATLQSRAGVHVAFVADRAGRYVAQLVVIAGGVESEPDQVVIELSADLVTDVSPTAPDVDRCGDSLD